MGALAAKPLRTRSVPASASPQSRRRALPPAKDVGILTMTPSVIANSRFRTILPTNHPCGCAEVPKNILSFKGLQSTLAQMIRRRTIFGNNILSPRNGSKIKPANADACRQSKVRKRGKGVKEKADGSNLVISVLLFCRQPPFLRRWHNFVKQDT